MNSSNIFKRCLLYFGFNEVSEQVFRQSSIMNHGWLDYAVVLHCPFVLLQRMKLLAATEKLA